MLIIVIDQNARLISKGESEMTAKLVAYEYVPSGFEMVIDNKDVEMGKVWNLWHNVKLTDDL